MTGVLGALLLTLIAGAATGIGGALVLFKKKLSSNTLAGALGLSAGVMIFISLAELFPEAQAEIMATGSFRHGEALVLLAFFAGMGIIMLIDFLVPKYENPHEASGLSLGSHTPAVWAAWGTIIETRDYLPSCVRDMISIGKKHSAEWFTAGARSKKAGHPHHPACRYHRPTAS